MGLKVKILRKPEVTELAGEKVMIDFETGKYYMLKGVANDIWDILEDGITAEIISEKLLVQYEVDEKTCLESVREFLDSMTEKGLISLS